MQVSADQITSEGIYSMTYSMRNSWESLVPFRVKSPSVEGALSPVCPSSQKIHMIQKIDIE